MGHGEEGFTIDLSGLTDRHSLHDRLREALPLPAWYGANLDALYDVFTDPVLGRLGEVRFLGCAEAEQALKGYFRAFCRVCRAAEEENPDLSFRFVQSGRDPIA